MPDIRPVFRIEHHDAPKLALDAKPTPSFWVTGTGSGDGLSPRERKIAMDAVRRDAAASRRDSEARAKPIQAAYRAAAATPAFEKRYPNAVRVKNLGTHTGEVIAIDSRSGSSGIPEWAADTDGFYPEETANLQESDHEKKKREAQAQKERALDQIRKEYNKPKAGYAAHAHDTASRWPNAMKIRTMP